MSILRKSLARPDDKGRSGRERSSRRCKFPLTSSFRSLSCAPWSPTSPCSPSPTPPRPGSGSAGTPAPSDELRVARVGPPRNRQAQPLAGGRDGDPPRPDHPHRPARRPAQRRRPDHRPRGPFDVKAVQWIRHAYHVPAPTPYAARRDQRSRRRRTAATAASASSTTGSRPANSPPAAAPATGSASPGTDHIERRMPLPR